MIRPVDTLPVQMLLALKDVHKSYTTSEGPLRVLKGVSFAMAAGRSLALTGESGSGKSTLLHLVAGLDAPDYGEILLEGNNIAGLPDAALAAMQRSSVGLIFRQLELSPSRDDRANLAVQARVAGRHDAEWAKFLSGRLGLSELLDRYPEQLSGGQQQRVAIGRTLAARPRLVLADEPTGNLDEATADAVLDLMLSLQAEAQIGLLMVTHSPRLAARLDGTVHLRAGRVA